MIKFKWINWVQSYQVFLNGITFGVSSFSYLQLQPRLIPFEFQLNSIFSHFWEQFVCRNFYCSCQHLFHRVIPKWSRQNALGHCSESVHHFHPKQMWLLDPLSRSVQHVQPIWHNGLFTENELKIHPVKVSVCIFRHIVVENNVDTFYVHSSTK